MEKTGVAVGGMHCASCAQAVEHALKAVPGVHDATVNLLAGNAAVSDDGTVPLQALTDAVEAAGYHATVAESARRLTIAVQGMTCAGCAQSVERALSSIPGVIRGPGFKPGMRL